MLEVRSASFDEVGALLYRKAEETDTSGGMLPISEMVQGCALFEVVAGGEQVGAFALTMQQMQRGAVCWIMRAAGKLSGVSLANSILPHIESMAQRSGAKQVAITTKRNGLVKLLQAHGYEVTGVTLRKKML